MKKLTFLTFMFAFLTVPLLYGQTNSFSSGNEYANETGQTGLQSIELNNPPLNAPTSNTGNFQNNAITVISHNSSNAISNLFTGCASTDTPSFSRVFDLAGDFGIVEDFDVLAVEFSTFYFSGGPNTVIVDIYSTPTGTYPGGTLTLLGTNTTTASIADNSTIQTVPVTATIPAGESLVYVVTFVGDGTQDGGMAGNTAPQTDITWVNNTCGLTSPVDFGGAFSVIMNVLGEEVLPPPPGELTYCATDTPLDFAPPVSTSSLNAVSSTANPGDTGVIGIGLGDYSISDVTINSITDSAQDRAYSLQSPSGSILALDLGNGGTDGLVTAADLIFRDSSPVNISSWTGGSPNALGYTPQGGILLNTFFAGESIDGDWYLIVDSNPGNQVGGTVNSYCITFQMVVGTAPEIFCPADFAADNDEGVCGAVVNFASPIAIDAEDGVLDPMNVVQTGGLPTGSEFPVGDNDVTFTATDSQGNETSCTFVITVNDAEAPMAVCQDVTVTLNAMGMGSIVAADLDGGSTDNCAVFALDASQVDFTCADTGEVTVTLEVFDEAGNSTTCEATVTVVDDTAPVITCIGEPSNVQLSHNTDNIITASNSVACPNGDNLFARHFVLADFGITDEFSISSGQFGVQENPAALDVTVNVWDVSAGFPAGHPGTSTLLGSEPVNIPALSDGTIINYSFATPVVVPNGATAILVEVSQDAGSTFFIGGTAGETDDSWLSSVVCGLPEYDTATSIGFPDAHYYITVTGSTGSAGPPFEVDLNADGTVSVLASDLISGVDEACGYTVTVPGEAAATSLATIFGTNNNGAAGGAVYFDVTVGDNELSLESIDVNTDAASFTADVYAFEGTYVGNEGDMAAWGTPTNGTGTGAGVDMPSNVVLDAAITLSANTTYAMAVVMDATAGHFYTNGDGSNEAFSNADLSMALGAASNVPFDGSPFSPRIFNGALHYSGGATGSGPELLLDCSNLGENIVEIIVTDNSGNSSSCFATVVVSDVTAPVIVCGPGDGAVSVLEEFEGSSVPTGWSTVINSGTSDWTFGSGTMPNSDPFPTNAVIFDDDAADPAELNNVTLLSPMYDLTGGVTTASVSYDYSLDILTGGGETLAVEVYDGTAWQQIALYDADVIPPTNSGAMDVLAYANADFQVRFTYDDDSGAWAWGAGVDNFQLDYAIPPTNTEVIIELGEDGTTTLDPMDFLSEAYDACGIDVLIADLEMVTCDDIGAPITVTVFATDASGNVASCSVEVLVVDTMAPVLTCPEDESVMVDPDGSHTLADYIGDGAATATDNCTDPVSDFTQSPAPGTILGVGTHIITFTATDEYGNVSTCEMTLDLTILGTQDNELNNAIALYPNPANEQVTISNSSNIALETAMIYDLNGKLVSQINLQDMQSEQVINVSGFATGVYMVYITGEQSSVVKRLIKK